ncbi:MAG: exodeoxyribonuclease III [Oligoflexia bacterium]|nr:exodeoxyribonuclease III [Oligoflexia bacterium]
MKLSSWNVNGIRAAHRAGFLKWFEAQNADIVCLQETKAQLVQLDQELHHPLGYHSFWHSAEKAGYSGVAIYSKSEPLSVREGIGRPEIDREGRVLVAEYRDFTLLNCYFPNSQRDHARLGYKLAFCDAMLATCEELRRSGRHLVLCGDLNIAHQDIDLRNPRSNDDNAGFLPEERAWMTKFLATGYADVFRERVKEPHHYTWWSYRPGVREKNIGWRLDYHLINGEFRDRVQAVSHQPQVRGSDHCPVLLELRD